MTAERCAANVPPVADGVPFAMFCSRQHLVARHHNPTLTTFEKRLREREKPHKAIIIAVARKIVTIVNAMCKSRQICAN